MKTLFRIAVSLTAALPLTAAAAFALVGRPSPGPPALGRAGEPLDLRSATIVVAPAASEGERLAAGVLREEIADRTGLAWTVSPSWPAQGPVIALTLATTPAWAFAAQSAPTTVNTAAGRAEGYRLTARADGGRPLVWIVGADRRGLLYGVGALLRTLDWSRQTASLPQVLDVATSPRYAIRGHQLGYRQHSNTYDGWDVRALRALHPRAGDVRREQRREHSLSGHARQPAVHAAARSR